MTAVWLRAFYGSIKAYKQGETYLKQHQYIRAITFFDRSIHWYAPFNPIIRKSAERLWEVGVEGASKGDIKLALIAFRTIRQGFYSARSFYQPGRDWIERCDLQIKKLEQRVRAPNVTRSGSERDGRFVQGVQKIRSPHLFWSIFLEIGLIGWIGSLIGFILCVFKEGRKERPVFPLAFKFGGLAVIFLAMWIIGMIMA